MSKKLLILLPLLISTTVLAAPPTTKYTPGETTDPNCAPNTINCDIEFTQGDTTDDAFLNNPTDQRVELSTKSDGTTRDANTDFVVTDEGRVGVGVTPSSTRKIDVLSQEERAVIHAETLDTTDSDQAYAAFEANTPISKMWMNAHGEHRTITRWGLPSLSGWTELIGLSNGADSSLYQGLVVGTKSGTPLLFGTNDAERIRITNEGLVGIGTPDPQNNRLSVSYSSPYTSARGILVNLGTSAVTDVVSYDRGIQSYVGNFRIPAGVTDSGYKIGLEASAYAASDAEFMGTLNLSRGVWARSGIHKSAAGGHINNAYAVHADILANDADGSIGNAYGVFINNGSGITSIANNYGLYQATDTARNYFAGRVGIAGNSKNPEASLQIGSATQEGTIMLGGGKGYAYLGAERSSSHLHMGYNIYNGNDGTDNSVTRVAADSGVGASAIGMKRNGEIRIFGINGTVTADDQINTDANTKVIIDGDGDVGIGMVNPDSKLAVSGLPSGADDSMASGSLAGAVCITDTGNMYIDTDGTCAN